MRSGRSGWASTGPRRSTSAPNAAGHSPPGAGGGDERPERRGPVLLGAEEEADRVLSHPPSQKPRQMMRDLAPPGGPVVRHVVSPEIHLVPNALLAEK